MDCYKYWTYWKQANFEDHEKKSNWTICLMINRPSLFTVNITLTAGEKQGSMKPFTIMFFKHFGKKKKKTCQVII